MKYHVFDHPTSFDRYTIIDQHGDMLSLSDDPTAPNGVDMFAGNCVDNYMSTTYGSAWRKRLDEKKIVRRMLRVIIPQFERDGSLGKPIKFSDLPELHQRIAKERFES